jgi:hypothetical protein
MNRSEQLVREWVRRIFPNAVAQYALIAATQPLGDLRRSRDVVVESALKEITDSARPYLLDVLEDVEGVIAPLRPESNGSEAA